MNIVVMKIILILIILSSFTFAQNPTVSNITFTQRTDGSHIVDIYYDVQNPTGNPMTVTMEASDDNGTTWNFPCTQISGDVGAGITTGNNKHIVWNFGTEHPQTFDDQFRIKIITDDGGVVMGIPCPGIPTITYAGKTYNTVQIGNQCWLKENLDIGTMILGSQSQTNNSTIEKYCYDNNSNNCNTYGGLYQWNEAMQYATNEGARGICPEGWHIPTYAEFQTLKAAVNNDGNSLKAIGQGSGGGAGTNTSGFSALLSGDCVNYGNFLYLGYRTFFWSSREGPSYSALPLWLSSNNSNINLNYCNSEDGFSVRCLKD